MEPKKTVKMKRLKEYSVNLPAESILREVLLQEEDELSASQFVDRIPLYLKLAIRNKPK
jgi:hypothetical protein